MNEKKNAAHVAVQAEPCQKTALQAGQHRAQMDCKRIFGVDSPDGVIAPMLMAVDALGWLEQVLQTIATDAGVTPRIKCLADMGAYLAADIAGLSADLHGQMCDAIKNGGAA